MADARQTLLACYQAALRAVEGRGRVARWFAESERAVPPHVVAVGKAAGAMLQGALDAGVGAQFRALAISKADHLSATLCEVPGVSCLTGEHPVPGEGSLAAGEALLDFIARTPPDEPMLFLISGGTSSLVEVLPQGVTLARVAELNRWLLGSGLDIHAINRVRRACSLIKGGGLLHYLQGRPVLVLLVSDVPGNDPAVIGSGPLVPAQEPGALPELPPEFAGLVHTPTVVADAGDVEIHIIASLEDALAAAAQAGSEFGLAVTRHVAFLSGDPSAVAGQVLDELRDAPEGLHLWGGEVTPSLPPHPGRGGRAQQLALEFAQRIADRPGIYVLAAGTDGSDGATGDAGALVDGGSVARGRLGGFEAEDCLKRADAGRFLETSGDLIHTGPTGTNVMDVLLVLKCTP
ncbi:MAG: DUF4147 domain-containing protein [Gammaproteobacteria bacterium]